MSLVFPISLALAAGAPEGKRAPGVYSLYKADPAGPEWLRKASEAQAMLDTRRYAREVYAGANQWLVRFVLLPEGDEAFREIVQIYAYPAKGAKTGKTVPPEELSLGDQDAKWKGEAYRLVERQDVIRP